MKSSCYCLLLVSFFLLHASLLTSPSFGVVVGFEDFDGNSINLASASNVADYGSGGGSGSDVFGRVSKAPGTGMPLQISDDSVTNVGGMISGISFPGDTLGIAGQNTTSFFAMNSMHQVNGSGLNNAVWSFNLAATPGTIENIQIDIAAMGDYSTSLGHGFLIQARVDADPYAKIFQATPDEAIDKTYRAFDDGDTFLLNDPLQIFIDGSSTRTGLLDKSDPSTGKFDTYTSTLLAGKTGSTLDVWLSWSGTPGGSNPMGIDNITINSLVSVPEPSAFLFWGLISFVLGANYARRQLQQWGCSLAEKL